MHILYVEVPNTWEKQHHRIGLSRVVIRPRYHKGEGRIAMTHGDPSVVSSHDSDGATSVGDSWVSKPRGSCSAIAQKRPPTRSKRGRGEEDLGSLTREPSLEGAEERTIGRCTDDRAGTSRQDRSRAVRGRWPVEQPRKKAPVPTGTPRGRPRRVFTAASCEHTEDKHGPIRDIDHERVAKPRISRGSLAACIGEEM